MKKIVLIAGISAALILALAGCAGGASTSAASSAETSSSTEASSSEPQTGMANPWSEVASAEEAAAGAGVGEFSLPLNVETSLGAIDEQYVSYRCMEGMAEAEFPIGAVEMTIRKALAADYPDGDCSGDYNEYAHTWTQDVNGVQLNCFGNREGESTRTIWTAGDYCYCILAMGAGGDTDYGLPADDLAVMVPAIK